MIIKPNSHPSHCRSMYIGCHHVYLDGSFIVVCLSVSVLLHRRVALGAGQLGAGGEDHQQDTASRQHGRWESTGLVPLLPASIYLRLFYPNCSLSTHAYKRGFTIESTMLKAEKVLTVQPCLLASSLLLLIRSTYCSFCI